MGIREMVLDKAKKEGIAEGKQEGKEEAKSEFVKTLLALNQFTNAQIAEMVNESELFVESIKNTSK